MAKLLVLFRNFSIQGQSFFGKVIGLIGAFRCTGIEHLNIPIIYRRDKITFAEIIFSF